MNKAGETHSCSAEDKLPESTGDKLPTGEIDSTLLGRLWTVLGNGSTGVSGIPLGNNLRLRLPGMLVGEHLYTPLGNIEICWGYPTSLRLPVG